MPTFATAGHVDHGKSTLIFALTGQDPDRLTEEKTRGLTIDLGFAWIEEMDLGFVDVPGHQKFLGNMLAGAALVDGCLFVVSAKEKLMPQSLEHLHILDLFGIRDGVVALTNVAGIPDKELDSIQKEIQNSLSGSFLENAQIVKTDAPTGIGIGELKTALKSLLERLPASLDLNNPRFWIDRSFVISGSGTVVTSTLTLGSLEVGDELVLLPSQKLVKVRGIQSLGKEKTKVGPGIRTALNITKVSADEVRRGDVLVKPKKWFHTKTFDVSLSVLPSAHSKVTEKGAYMIYLGTADFRIRISMLGGQRSIKEGKSGIVRIFLEKELPLKLGDKFILRDVGRQNLIGGGEILDLAPVLKSSKAQPSLSIVRILKERGGFMKTQELELVSYPLISESVETGYITLGEWTILDSVLEDLKSKLMKQLESAQANGIKSSDLNDIELEVLNSLDNVSLSRGKLFLTSVSKTNDHPYLELLDENPFAPPSPKGHIEKELLRDFVLQKLVVESEEIFFSSDAVSKAQKILAELLAESPEGITVSEFKNALNTTRKYALSLLGHFDSVGVSRRRGDYRLAGPRL